MAILNYTPFFAIILVVYNILMVIGPDFGQPVMSATMMSGAAWSATMGDVLIIFGVLCLYVELFKATRTTVASIVDHVISLAVFVVFLVEFIIIKGAGTSTFLILGLMSLLDVVAGFTITISTARRDLIVDR